MQGNRAWQSVEAGTATALGERKPGLCLGLLLAIFWIGAAVLATSGIYLLALYLAESATGQTYTNQFSLWVFFLHLALGVALIVPFVALALVLLLRRPTLSGRAGVAAFLCAGALVALSGVALIQLGGLPRLATGTAARNLVYLVHVLSPLLAASGYVAARRGAGPIRWRWGVAWTSATVGAVVIALGVHLQNPQKWNIPGDSAGEPLFEPSKTRTVDGKHIPSTAFMNDHYCQSCHKDAYDGWFHSVHHFSSFNNPVYRFSVRETRLTGINRDGHVRASRWCAGCHDPVPFLDGEFDDPDYDDVENPTAHAGITCTVCHAITNVNSTIGNGDYTIEPPQHYPFADSKSQFLRWVNRQLIKARPDFHKKSFLKPLHKDPAFCSTCHKVGLPYALNHYKEFLRGQNHWDNYLLSGASGQGARGFYYPPVAKTHCNDCHMPLKGSDDFAARNFDGTGRKIHDHLTPGANTGVPWLVSYDRTKRSLAEGLRQAAKTQAEFLRGGDPDGKDRKLRIDVFGLKKGGTIDGELIAPLRPELPTLDPGQRYLVEVVIRTLDVAHLFPQGTVDSNEIWVEFTARSGDRVLGTSGALSGPGDAGNVDEWAHFVNALVLDRHGNRINRHNPQDIFTALYDHQIPPGAAQVVHYALEVPKDVAAPIELKVRLRYRKFDYEYVSQVWAAGLPRLPDKLRKLPPRFAIGNWNEQLASFIEKRLADVPVLPIVDLCEDQVTLAVRGVATAVSAQASPIQPAWQRWNDYGIGCYLEGGAGSKKGELRQAEAAFRHLLTLPDREAHAHAYLNLARVYNDEGRLAEAAEALNQARTNDPPAPWWTIAWLTGVVNSQTGNLDEAIANFEKVLDSKHQPRERKFDFTRDYVIINALAQTLFKKAQQAADPTERDQYLRRAAEQFERTLAIDSEDLEAHYGLSQCYLRLGAGVNLSAETATTAPVAEEELRRLLAKFLETGRPVGERLSAAARFDVAVARYGAQPSDPDRSKLLVLNDLVRRCRPAYGRGDEKEAVTEAQHLPLAAARILGQLYRQTHAILKPDDNARDRAVRIYRQKDPAGNHAAQAIVIYPLQRPDAPALSTRPTHGAVLPGDPLEKDRRLGASVVRKE